MRRAASAQPRGESRRREDNEKRGASAFVFGVACGRVLEEGEGREGKSGGGGGRTLRRNDPCHLRHLCNLDRQVRRRDPQKARVVFERVDDVVDVERPDVGRAEEDGGLDESFLEA